MDHQTALFHDEKYLDIEVATGKIQKNKAKVRSGLNHRVQLNEAKLVKTLNFKKKHQLVFTRRKFDRNFKDSEMDLNAAIEVDQEKYDRAIAWANLKLNKITPSWKEWLHKDGYGFGGDYCWSTGSWCDSDSDQEEQALVSVVIAEKKIPVAEELSACFQSVINPAPSIALDSVVNAWRNYPTQFIGGEDGTGILATSDNELMNEPEYVVDFVDKTSTVF